MVTKAIFSLFPLVIKRKLSKQDVIYTFHSYTLHKGDLKFGENFQRHGDDTPVVCQKKNLSHNHQLEKNYSCSQSMCRQLGSSRTSILGPSIQS